MATGCGIFIRRSRFGPVYAAAAEATVQTIIAADGEALSVGGDVAKPDDVRRMVEAAEGQFGPVDILACIAGVLRTSAVEQISENEWDLVLDVNLKGVFLCSQSVIPQMKARRAGKIVILASLAGRATSTLGGSGSFSSSWWKVC